MRRFPAILAIPLLVLPGCREADGPADPGAVDARVHLMSSPNGARIMVDGRNTGQVTPDTVGLRRGDRVVRLELDSLGFTYEYSSIVRVEQADSVIDITLPIGRQCTTPTCFNAQREEYNAAGLTFSAGGSGTLLHSRTNSDGLAWPASTVNRYVASGMPVFAAMANSMSVSIGVYDQGMLVGLPAPTATRDGDTFRLTQRAWILPPPTVSPSAVRGILIETDIHADDTVAGVLVLRLRFINVSDNPLVHMYAPQIPMGAVTYTNTWVGLALDPDIGSATDDWVSYDVDQDMVFAYDADFAEPLFTGEHAGAPGLVGLRVLDAPPGTSVLLNSWSIGSDWSAGTQSQAAGYGMLTGAAIITPQHAHEKIGHMPGTSRDVRMSVTAGPMTLAPGDTAEVVVAIAVAPPVAGTYTSGLTVAPGDPLDTNRTLHAIAAELRARMDAAVNMPGLTTPP